MQQRNVGKSGLRVGSVGLGCNNFGWTIDEDASRKVVHKALDLGVNLFDTADFYGDPPGNSETVLGNVLGARRKDVVLVTKFGVPLVGERRFNNSRSYVLGAIEASLQRLRTDWIDVYMIHWPDATTPMEETLRVLDDLVTAGKVRYIACSNLAPWRMVEAKWISQRDARVSFVAAQNEYSLIARGAEADIIPALEAYGMGLMPYYPLANGLLTGKYIGRSSPEGRLGKNFLKLGDRYLTEANIALTERLSAFAAERGHTLLELAISWLLSRPVVASVIAGATKPEQIEQNVNAAQWTLSAEEVAAVDGLRS